MTQGTSPKNVEIERKFLVTEQSFDKLLPDLEQFYKIQQGYIVNQKDIVVRLRIDERFGSKVRPPVGIICIKRPTEAYLVRSEEEHEIDVKLARGIIERLPQLYKIRYRLDGRYTFDVFQGDLKGLILAELEYDTIEEAEADTVLPEWAKADVTSDPTYLNSNLIGKKFINGAVA